MAADLPLPSDPGGDEWSSGCTISCSDCRLRDTSACDDCVVTFLLGPELGRAVARHPAVGRVRPVAPVRLDAEEAQVLRLFQDAGLAPSSRHARRVG